MKSNTSGAWYFIVLVLAFVGLISLIGQSRGVQPVSRDQISKIGIAAQSIIEEAHQRIGDDEITEESLWGFGAIEEYAYDILMMANDLGYKGGK